MTKLPEITKRPISPNDKTKFFFFGRLENTNYSLTFEDKQVLASAITLLAKFTSRTIGLVIFPLIDLILASKKEHFDY